MEVLRASPSNTPSSTSDVLCGAGGATTDDTSNGSSRESAAAALRQGECGDVDDVQASNVSCAGVRNTTPPHVLSHLLNLNTHGQLPTFPATASAAAAVLLAFANAPCRAESTPASVLSGPDSPAVNSFPAASPVTGSRSSHGAAVGAHSISPALSLTESGAHGTFAPLRGAPSAFGLDSAVEQGLRRPFAIEEETQLQLLEEEDDVATAAAEAAGSTSSNAVKSSPPATVAVVLREQETREFEVYSTVVAQDGDEAGSHQENYKAATGHARTAEGHAEATLSGEGGDIKQAGATEEEQADGGSSADVEGAVKDASISAELIESCVVPWKPTCLTEISFDYSVPSTRGGLAAASPSLLESQRSTTVGPSGSSRADHALESEATSAAGTSCSALYNRRPSGALEPSQCSAGAVTGEDSRIAGPEPQTTDTPITSNLDSGAAAAATEGIPSNVSRWRLGSRQQKQHSMQQEVLLQEPQISESQLRPIVGNKEDEPLKQQQAEVVLVQQQVEDQLNVHGQAMVQLLLEQHLKKRVQLQAEQQVNESLQSHTLLQTGLPLQFSLQQHVQGQEAEQLLQPQLHEEPQQGVQHHQRQDHQKEELVRNSRLQDAERLFNMVVQQLQRKQQDEKQKQNRAVVQQYNTEKCSVLQEGLQRYPCDETVILSKTQELSPYNRPEEVDVQHQRQQHPNSGTALSGKASFVVTRPAAEALERQTATDAQSKATDGAATLVGDSAPATGSPQEMTKPLPVAVAAGGVLAAAAAAAAAAASEKTDGGALRQKYAHLPPRRRKRKSCKGGRFVQTSSSGYPGVSWNRRMGAWLAFFYDTQSRRSRTFHPRYFNGDIEATRIAAIEFKKSVDRLFSSRAKAEENVNAASVQQNIQEEGGEQEVEPQEKEGLEETPEQKQSLNINLERPAEQLSEPTAHLRAAHVSQAESMQDQHQEDDQQTPGGVGDEVHATEGGNTSSLLDTVVPHVLTQGGDCEAFTTGRKRAREDDVVGGEAATFGRMLSSCLALPQGTSMTDLASALLPPGIALNDLVALGENAETGCRRGAAVKLEPTAAAVAAIAGAAAMQEMTDGTALAGMLGGTTDRTISTDAVPVRTSHETLSTGTANALQTQLNVDLSALATMGSHERLQKVLSFGTEVQGMSARRLAFSWSRLSTLSTEGLNALYKSSRSNVQLLAPGAGAAYLTAGSSPAGATEEATRTGSKAAALSIQQLLRQGQGEEVGKEEERNLSMPSLLQQLQLNEGAAAAAINTSETHADDAALLTESEEELYRILKQSCGFFPFPLLWRGDLRFADSSETHPEATPRSELQDGSFRADQKDPSFACNTTDSGTATNESSVKCTSSGSSSTDKDYCRDRTSGTDGPTYNAIGMALHESNMKEGTVKSVAVPNVEGGGSCAGALRHDAQPCSLERICHLLSERATEHPGEEKQEVSSSSTGS